MFKKYFIIMLLCFHMLIIILIYKASSKKMKKHKLKLDINITNLMKKEKIIRVFDEDYYSYLDIPTFTRVPVSSDIKIKTDEKLNNVVYFGSYTSLFDPPFFIRIANSHNKISNKRKNNIIFFDDYKKKYNLKKGNKDV